MNEQTNEPTNEYVRKKERKNEIIIYGLRRATSSSKIYFKLVNVEKTATRKTVITDFFSY